MIIRFKFNFIFRAKDRFKTQYFIKFLLHKLLLHLKKIYYYLQFIKINTRTISLGLGTSLHLGFAFRVWVLLGYFFAFAIFD